MDLERHLDAVRELRTELGDVIADSDTRADVEQQLDAALAAPEEIRNRQVADVLRARPETRAWMAQRVTELEVDRIVQPSGAPENVGTYFVCPHADFDFVRDHVGDPVPICPQHRVALVMSS